MHAVLVQFEVDVTRLEEFMPLMAANADTSLKSEPGCLRFDICTDPARPGDVMLYELYEDAEAFAAHLGSVHFKTFDAAVADMIKGKHVERYDVVRPAHG